ncbi:MAG: hypothetical protein AAGC55_01625, partial [Myxococcota bacterium]
VVAADGVTAVPGARVTWIAAAIEPAGTIGFTGEPAIAAQGSYRSTMSADGDGQLPARTVPRGQYSVVIEPGPGADTTPAIAAVDLDVAAPDTLTLASPARLRGQVLTATGSALPEAQLSAVPTGILAGATTAATTITSASDGSFELTVVGGGEYELIITGPNWANGRLYVPASAPAPGTEQVLPTVRMPAMIQYLGRVEYGGAGVEGATLRLLCAAACTEELRGRPLAQAVSDRFGDVRLAVPDPGVE